MSITQDNVAKAGASLNALMRQVRAICEQAGCVLSREQEDAVAEALAGTVMRLVLARERYELAEQAMQEQSADTQKLRAEATASRDPNADRIEQAQTIRGLQQQFVQAKQEIEQQRDQNRRQQAELNGVVSYLSAILGYGKVTLASASQAAEQVRNLVDALRARVSVLGSALTELVNLHDHVKHEEPEIYERRKPHAWAAARQAIAVQSTVAAALLAELQRGRALVREVERLRQIEVAAQVVVDESECEPASVRFRVQLDTLNAALRQPRHIVYNPNASYPLIPYEEAPDDTGLSA